LSPLLASPKLSGGGIELRHLVQTAGSAEEAKQQVREEKREDDQHRDAGNARNDEQRNRKCCHAN